MLRATHIAENFGLHSTYSWLFLQNILSRPTFLDPLSPTICGYISGSEHWGWISINFTSRFKEGLLYYNCSDRGRSFYFGLAKRYSAQFFFESLYSVPLLLKVFKATYFILHKSSLATSTNISHLFYRSVKEVSLLSGKVF